MNSAFLLSADERCNRLGFWTRDWQRSRIEQKDLLAEGIKAGLLSTRPDFGQVSGERVIEIASTKEVFIDDKASQYDCIVHTASLSDLVSSALRKSSDPWRLPEAVSLGDGLIWHPSCYLSPSGESLRRIALVSGWSEDRHFHECRSWDTLGNMAVYDLPMQIAIVVLGSHRSGKYYSAWTRGFRHPINKGLRFKRKAFVQEKFKSSWSEIWREDFDEISTAEWLSRMAEDNVLADLCFRVDVPPLNEESRERILNLARSKMKRILSTTELPEQNLSICDWPVRCAFLNPCHSQQEPSGRFGFVRIGDIDNHR